MNITVESTYNESGNNENSPITRALSVSRINLLFTFVNKILL